MNILERLRSLRFYWRLPTPGRLGISLWAIIGMALWAVIFLTGIALSVVCWDWLNGGESGSTTIRNISIVIAGWIALPLAVWRARVADRQASAAQHQVDSAQQSLLNERYQKGAEMLGSEVLSVRMGGIYALERLAREHAEQYHIQIMALFCAFVRRPPNDEESSPRMVPDATVPPLRQDVQSVVAAVAARDESRRALERKTGTLVKQRIGDVSWLSTGDFYFDPLYALDLRHADLKGVWLRWGGDLSGARLDGADLSNADLTKMSLSETHFHNAILYGAELTGANLTGAQLIGADLSHTVSERVDLTGANLFGANLSGAWLQRANLTAASLGGANLSGADLRGADLSGANLLGANLSGADLYGAGPLDVHMPVIGLNQAQLDEASADPANPPKLGGVVQDAGTGVPLVWQSTPLGGEV